jgi:hypothetical protein
MTPDIKTYLPLVAKCREQLAAAFRKVVVTRENADNERTKFLVGLAVASIDGVRGIEALLDTGLYVQALILCRSNFECLAVASSINVSGSTKLFEKESLKHFKSRLKDLGLLQQVQGLDQTIDGLHPRDPQKWRELFDDFERQLQSDPAKSYFYSSYRHFSSYVHPDFMRIFDTVTIEKKRLGVDPHIGARKEVILLGLGLLGAVGTVMTINSVTCGIGFPEPVCKGLEGLLHETMNLVAPSPAIDDSK